jgi:hypothetical protein
MLIVLVGLPAPGDVARFGPPVRTGGDTFLLIVMPPPLFAFAISVFLRLCCPHLSEECHVASETSRDEWCAQPELGQCRALLASMLYQVSQLRV